MKLVLTVAITSLAAVAIVLLSSCTENARAKSSGGTASVALPAKQKLVNVTWKEANLWYLSRPMREDEKPETYTFSEKSSWGVVEGTVIFTESK